MTTATGKLNKVLRLLVYQRKSSMILLEKIIAIYLHSVYHYCGKL